LLDGHVLLDVAGLDRRAVRANVHEPSCARTRELRALTLERTPGVVRVARDTRRAQLGELGERGRTIGAGLDHEEEVESAGISGDPLLLECLHQSLDART